MLKLPSAPTGEAEDIVKRFISDRLAEIMEDRMANCLADSLINKRNPDSEDGLLSYDELVASLNAKKLEELTDDLYFAEEVSRYAPRYYPIEKACCDFISLYKLLKVEKEYVPELTMEYILFRLIYSEIDRIEMASASFEEHINALELRPTTIQRIPEPGRSIVIKALEEESDGEYTAEDQIRYYEDLCEYPETCFWDYDFEMLNYAPEDMLLDSPLGETMGLSRRDDKTQVEVMIDGVSIVKGEFQIHPWELEFGK